MDAVSEHGDRRVTLCSERRGDRRPEGERVREFFTFTVTDGSNATDSKTLTINVTGANDAAVITVMSQVALRKLVVFRTERTRRRR